jgi:hypothetical protein
MENKRCIAFSLRPFKFSRPDEPPPHVTHDDVERFYTNHDMDGLHKALVAGFILQSAYTVELRFPEPETQ